MPLVTPTFTFTVDSASMSPIVLSAAGGVSSLGVVSYREPARERDNFYADGSTYAPRALLSSMPSPTFHTLLLVPQVTSQAAEDTALNDLYERLSQFNYQCVDTRNSAARTWSCQPGSMTPANDRTRLDLAFLKPLWSVTIPCDATPV